MNTTTVVLLVVLILAVAAIAWLVWSNRRVKLQQRFGPEYDQAVSAYGNRREAEKELRHREERRRKFDIRPLTLAEQDRFIQAWRWDQSHFVDRPESAVEEAHKLVTEVMRARGYPVSDFEQQAADLSVDHPRVVQNYRRAHEVYQRHQQREASTEDLRTAMIHYRSLFEQLVDHRLAAQPETRWKERAV